MRPFLRILLWVCFFILSVAVSQKIFPPEEKKINRLWSFILVLAWWGLYFVIINILDKVGL